jgi:hypothetical protein
MKYLILLILLLVGCNNPMCNNKENAVKLGEKFCKCHGGIDQVIHYCTLKSTVYCVDGRLVDVGDGDYIQEHDCK